MYVRLAFSVAAHMEPEILVVDEVLAVGDLEFQQKCLGKMSDVASEGRTVLFVSHNMAAINSLCDRVIVLDRGKMIFDGRVSEGIEAYINRNEDRARNELLSERKDRSGTQSLKATALDIMDNNGKIVDQLLSGEDYSFNLQIQKLSKEVLKNVKVSIDIYDTRDHRWLLFRHDFQGEELTISETETTLQCMVKKFPLTLGKYFCSIYLSVADKEMADFITHVAYFEVIGGDFFGTGSMGVPNNCKMLYDAKWIIS